MLEQRDNKWRTVAIVVVLIFGTFAAFWPSLQNGFIQLDDPDYVTNNPHVATGLNLDNLRWAMQASFSANWHPVTWISHMLDVELFGLQPRWHHVMSLLLHTLNATLLFFLMRRLTGSEWRSAIVAGLFALHPLRVESVAWVAERKDVLSTLFFILTLFAYAAFTKSKAPREHSLSPESKLPTSETRVPSPHSPSTRHFPPWLYYVLALFLFALGLMSKSMLVTLPFLLLLLDFWPFRRFQLPITNHQSPLRLLLEKVPFFCLAAGSCAITFLAQDKSGAVSAGMPPLLRVGNAIVSYVKYLGMTFWPANLCIFYQHPNTRYFAVQVDPQYPASTQWPLWAIVLSALLLAAICVGAVLCRKQAPWVAVGWFWYLGTLVPVIGIVQVGGQALADRYTYLPHIGLFLCLVWTATQRLGHLALPRIALAASAGVMLAALAIRTHEQVRYWRDDLTVFQHALDISPDNALAQFHVGSALAQRGRYQEALPHFQTAEKSNPWLMDSYRGLGMTFERIGNWEQALAQYQAALQLKPWLDWARARTGVVLEKLGRKDESLNQYAEAVRVNPASAEAHSNLGLALLERGQIPDATTHLAEAVRLNPDYDEARRALAGALIKQGRLAEAETHFRELATHAPTNFQARINLGGILWRTGKRDAAKQQYAIALQINPDDPVAHFDMGTVLAAEPRLDAAAAEFAEAIRLNTNYTEAFTEWGRALAREGKFDQALAKFLEAARLNPTNAELQVNLGGSLILVGKTNEAKVCFETALRLDPSLADKQISSAKALLAQGQLAPALARLRTALWLRPDDAEAHELIAQILTQQGKTEEAARHQAEARTLRQSHAPP